MNKKEYHVLCSKIGVTGNFKAYLNCSSLYKIYKNSMVIPYIKFTLPKKLIFFFLESCPQSTKDYIFNLNTKLNSDKTYLARICTGFDISWNKNKDQCLNYLLQYKTEKEPNENIPIIILDLFPFHGTNLIGMRQSITENISTPNILSDVKANIDAITNALKPELGKLFLFGVPYTIWNNAGGYGNGSLYCDYKSNKNGLLGSFNNITVIMNSGGQNISSNVIKRWREHEQVQ